ncbi:hypothetical protein EDD15DRAFT_2376184 [Pisolithus albus]|nr:hypothetical protein EDD15DRAFT_2376184 [Pisolithus albus]
MADLPEVSTQFTEDAFAKQDHYCERPKCGALIHQGEPEFYIATIEPGQRGRRVCSSCNLHYLRKPSTTVRKMDAARPANPANTAPANHVPPDALRIQKSVNAAQRGSINPPRVVAVSRGPDVPIPSAWHADRRPPLPSRLALPDCRPQTARAGGSAHTSEPTMPPPRLGYTSQHSRYTQEYDRWARWTYASPPAETISLKILAHYEGGPRRGRSQTTAFGNICEGKKDIDALISAHDLVPIALDTIIPKVKRFCPSFPWRFDEFTVRDTDWVDLAEHQSLVPFFYSQCLQPARKNPKAMSFKSKQFTLYVVVPAAQWLEFEAFMEKEKSVDSTAEGASVANVSSDEGDGERLTASSHTRSMLPSVTSSHTPSTLPSASTSTGDLAHRPFHSRVAQTTFMPARISSQIAPHNDEAMAATDALVGTAATTPVMKRTVVSPTPAATSPPRKIPALMAPFVSPSRAHLREALKSGGKSELDVDNVLTQAFETIQFYPIPTRPLAEILENPQYRSFNLDLSETYPGRLRVDQSPKSFIGIGGFKTAQSGLLMLTPPSPSGLGSKVHDNVVVKRPFLRPPTLNPSTSSAGPPPGGSRRIIRFSLGDELPKLHCEANTLYWAKALLTMTYDFIDSAISSAASVPPFKIPRLRFVEAGLAMAHSQFTKGLVKPKFGGTVCGVYLLEEKIEGGSATFTKYIHNMDCRPSLSVHEDGYDIAEFLAFTQHVQYSKTGGLVFISDYQGSRTLLTDPQILTDPSVGDGSDVFSEGNVESTVASFEKNHECNRFCSWPGFGLKEFGAAVTGVRESPKP